MGVVQRARRRKHAGNHAHVTTVCCGQRESRCMQVMCWHCPHTPATTASAGPHIVIQRHAMHQSQTDRAALPGEVVNNCINYSLVQTQRQHCQTIRISCMTVPPVHALWCWSAGGASLTCSMFNPACAAVHRNNLQSRTFIARLGLSSQTGCHVAGPLHGMPAAAIVGDGPV
jgi:hypothetical protein